MKKLITIIVGLAFITFIICTSCSNNKKTDSKNQRLARTKKNSKVYLMVVSLFMKPMDMD